MNASSLLPKDLLLALRPGDISLGAVSSLVFGFRSAWKEELRVVSRAFGNGSTRLG